MTDDEYEAELDAAEDRHEVMERERTEAPPAASESRTVRVLSDAAASARAALSPGTLDQRAPAIERSATQPASSAGEARRDRVAEAYGLYGAQRSPGEIVSLIVAKYGVSEATARADLRAVEDIVASWRNLPGWHERRDQHMMGLRHLLDLALADHAACAVGTPARGMALEAARKIMADMRTVEGFAAPTKGLVLHGHGSIDTTLPDGPGVVGGVSLRKLPPAHLAALRLILDVDATIEVDEGATADDGGRRAPLLDAVSVESGSDD